MTRFRGHHGRGPLAGLLYEVWWEKMGQMGIRMDFWDFLELKDKQTCGWKEQTQAIGVYYQ